MKIYYVRHGQTDWNLISKLQGRVDTELNETGIAQAESAKEKLDGVAFDKVFCSPLKRTRKTCEIITDNKCEIIFDERIIERDFGEYEGLMKTDFDYNGFWNSNKNQKFLKAESIFDIEKRVFSFFDEITEKYKDKTVLVVAHGGVGLFVTSYFNGKPDDGNYLQHLFGTGEIRIFEK